MQRGQPAQGHMAETTKDPAGRPVLHEKPPRYTGRPSRAQCPGCVELPVQSRGPRPSLPATSVPGAVTSRFQAIVL